MLKEIRKKLKSTAAFSLSETLMAVLLLSIVFTAVSGGVVVMQRDYDKIVVRAEQQTSLATTVSVITADLESASKITTDGTNVVCFYATRRNQFIRYVQGKKNEAYNEIVTVNPETATFADINTLGGSIYVGTTDGTAKLLTKSTPLLSSAAAEVFHSGNSANARLKTAVSPITYVADNSGKYVKYFTVTVGVAAKGASQNEYITINVKPYNHIPLT